MNCRHEGFTLIEMIVAMAIGVMLVTGVYAATQSMTRAARTQADAAKTGAPLRRAEEIVRNDLRGWIENTPTNTGAMGDETVLLSFTTASDSLVMASLPGARSSISVRYLVRRVLGQFELIRIEGSSLLPLLRTNVTPKIAYYDGAEWSRAWSKKERPAAIRLETAADNKITIHL
jgi:prepilin-type N-terminal cleavage/methylation domain-containing protein